MEQALEKHTEQLAPFRLDNTQKSLIIKILKQGDQLLNFLYIDDRIHIAVRQKNEQVLSYVAYLDENRQPRLSKNSAITITYGDDEIEALVVDPNRLDNNQKSLIIKILKQGDQVLNVSYIGDKIHIAVRQKNEEVLSYVASYDESGQPRLSKNPAITITYGDGEVEALAVDPNSGQEILSITA
jgi:hypothetical protein